MFMGTFYVPHVALCFRDTGEKTIQGLERKINETEHVDQWFFIMH